MMICSNFFLLSLIICSNFRLFFSSWALLYSNFWQGCQCGVLDSTDPEVLIALNSYYQSGILLYYIVHNAASSQRLEILLLLLPANNNASTVNYISA